MNAPLAPDWISANQQLLVLEFARLKALLRPEEHDGHAGIDASTVRTLGAARQYLGDDSAIDWLARTFELSSFERDLLLLCAGVEMDAGLARACAHGHGDENRPWASFGLALAALQSPHWSALSPHSPLRHWLMITVDNDAGLSTGRLRIDERILHFLAGLNDPDMRLSHLLRPAAGLTLQAGAHAACTEAVVATLSTPCTPPEVPPLTVLEGDDISAGEDIANRAAASLGLRCQVLQAKHIPPHADERARLLRLWQRESRLLGSALLVVIDDPDTTAGDGTLELLNRVGGITFVAAPFLPPLDIPTRIFRMDKPDCSDRQQLWASALGPAAMHAVGDDVAQAASHFRIGSRALQDIARGMQQTGRKDASAGIALWRTCREQSRRGLDALAQRISGTADWGDLVLPEAQLSILHQIASHLRQRQTVIEHWGFGAQGSRGLGLASLFAGESGTGKTLAAEVLANTLQLDLYRIDLSAVVSKYIGETEKNLRKVFDAAEDCGAILLFDEADALFGKRTEVKDSHDRYANIEVSYLLQRMESYHGLAILTTNLKSSLDSAFTRRLRFIVQFPFPDYDQRLALWKRAIPGAAPTADLDFSRLARLSVTGGSIRNIALTAAFLAADSGEAIGMKHLLHAAHGDAAKRERPLTDAETRGWT
ncbi:MAG: ATP-binding protein [Betaproteobacteria bacterium HGW-Betaproteobacteria-13]|jgi:hypothetical protein|nr:MAG: ATP-binding protein [Betaproteobacteria bacterium HGW-Betaproteobacteria-13]